MNAKRAKSEPEEATEDVSPGTNSDAYRAAVVRHRDASQALDLFRPAADAAACSRRLQSRQRAFADDIALELGLLQFPAKR
jgi:hypothetical protein